MESQENVAQSFPPPPLVLYQMAIGHYVSRALALSRN
jgi:hypothetical protein